MKIISTAALHPLKHALITIMLSRGKENKKAVPTVVLILFLILPERPEPLDLSIRAAPSTAPDSLFVGLFCFFFSSNGTCSDKHAATYDKVIIFRTPH